MNFENSVVFAQGQDAADVLKKYRSLFYIPIINGKEAVYFTGNSIGLQPTATQDYVLNILEDWATYGNQALVHGPRPWLTLHETLTKPLAKLAGALPQEVVATAQSTINLHLLLVSFYQPTATRYKILCEANAFPSHRYALQSQAKYHGFDAGDAIIEVQPDQGKYYISEDAILKAIDKHQDSLAMVVLGGVNYYTGQLFNMPAITKAAQDAGAMAGYDLAHAIGNIELNLHEWNIDFACWCNYKYLNGGYGSGGSLFIHEKHLNKSGLPRFEGWFGNNTKTKFNMAHHFEGTANAESWQISATSPMCIAAQQAAVKLFEEAGMDALRSKSKKLTAYMEFVIKGINELLPPDKQLQIITPGNENERGCQLSFVTNSNGKELHHYLMQQGVITDWREPEVIRCAPVPLYNSFEDVFSFGEIIKKYYHV